MKVFSLVKRTFSHPSPECISHSFAMLLQNFHHTLVSITVLRCILASQSKLHFLFSGYSLLVCLKEYAQSVIFQQGRRERCRLATLLSADISEKLHWNTALIYCLQDSIEERLGALDIDVSKVKTPGGLPQTDSFAVLLVQGLESNDSDILNVSVTGSLYAVLSVCWDLWGASLKAVEAEQLGSCCFS